VSSRRSKRVEHFHFCTCGTLFSHVQLIVQHLDVMIRSHHCPSCGADNPHKVEKVVRDWYGNQEILPAEAAQLASELAKTDVQE